MTLGWYRVLLCKPCGEGSRTTCEEPACARWKFDRGLRFGSEYSVQPLTQQEVDALDAAQWFARGGAL